MDFTEKVVLITGGSSGIGADAARHLSSLGAKVAIVGRNENRLNDVAEQIKSAGSPHPLPIVADVTKDAERIVNETIAHFGRLDILINNAGIMMLDKVAEFDVTNYDLMFDVNVRSVANLTSLCVPHLEKTKGNIINMSSTASFQPVHNAPTFCMTKAALDVFTRCSALELGPKGIRVNSLNPALIRTPSVYQFGIPADEMDRMIEKSAKKHPVGRVGEVSDTSAAIAYLADNKFASFITGVLFPVDGGALVAGINEL